VTHELVSAEILFKGIPQIFESERQMNERFDGGSGATC